MILLAFGLASGLALHGAQGSSPQTRTPASKTASSADAYFLFIQGRTLEGRGDVPGAIAAYRKAIDLMPGVADVRAELAGLYAREGRAAESIAEAEAALAIDPKNREAHRILGFVQSALADSATSPERQAVIVAQAIGHLEQAIAGGTRDPGTELTLGRLYVRTGQYAKGVATLQAFLVDQPGYAEGVLLLVEALSATGEPVQAIGLLEPVVRDEPDLVRARTWLAELYERTDRWGDAVVQWTELARANPRNPTMRSRRATALVNSGNVSAGRQALQELTAELPRDVSAWYLLSQVERRAGNGDAAEAAARRIAEIDSSDPRGPLAMAEAKSAKGDHRGAVATLEPLMAALRDAPATGVFARVASELAVALEATGERDRAIRVLEDARRRDAQDLSLVIGLAGLYQRDERFDLAERAYRDVLARDPAEAEALNGLGYLLADRGEKLDEAVELIRRALVIDPAQPAYLDSLGWAYARQGRHALAREPLERAAAARPNESLVLDHLAEVYFQLKQYREAATSWDRALAGDRTGIDVAAVTKKRNRARELAGRQ